MEELNRNLKIIEAGIDELLEQATAAEKEILKILLRSIGKYPTKGGRFVWDKNNLRLLNRLTPELAKALERANFEGSMLDYFDDFDEIGQNIADLHGRVNDVRVTKSSLNADKLVVVEQVVKGLAQANIDQTFLQPVRQGLYSRIRFGASVTETEAYLRELIVGTEKEGVISRWVGQVARDAANQYEGTINQRVAQEFNLTNYEYVGSIVKNSRPQCRRWVEKGRISKEELAGELEWAYNNGAGMIPGTTVETFAIYRGGYNCQHTAIPVK